KDRILQALKELKYDLETSPKPRRVSASIRVPIPSRYARSSRSLRSVMRLRRALPPQSRGKPRHCRAERGKTAKNLLLKKDARKALLSDIGLFGLLYGDPFFQLVIPGATDP
ncbi:hypothetical protein AB2I91_27360, partial (plasmid) [Escherichia coli]